MTETIHETAEITILFDETNVNWTRDPEANALFLKGVLTHMTNMLQMRGYVFLNDVYDALRFPRTKFGQTHGWAYDEVVCHYVDYAVPQALHLETPHLTIVFRGLKDILDILP